MKTYSSDTITKSEVEASLSRIDVKQTKQIHQLRLLLGISFMVNLLVAIGAYFFKV